MEGLEKSILNQKNFSDKYLLLSKKKYNAHL
jgi:hypothetical protein